MLIYAIIVFLLMPFYVGGGSRRLKLYYLVFCLGIPYIGILLWHWLDNR